MKTISFKSVFISLCMILSFSMASAQEEGKFIYDCKYENDKIVSKTIFELDSYNQELKQKAKYEYVYDEQGRILEKIAYRWNREDSKWENHFRMVCKYSETDDTVIVDYGTWDKKKKDFMPQQEMVYPENEVNKVIS